MTENLPVAKVTVKGAKVISKLQGLLLLLLCSTSRCPGSGGGVSSKLYFSLPDFSIQHALWTVYSKQN